MVPGWTYLFSVRKLIALYWTVRKELGGTTCRTAMIGSIIGSAVQWKNNNSWLMVTGDENRCSSIPCGESHMHIKSYGHFLSSEVQRNAQRWDLGSSSSANPPFPPCTPVVWRRLWSPPMHSCPSFEAEQHRHEKELYSLLSSQMVHVIRAIREGQPLQLLPCYWGLRVTARKEVSWLMGACFTALLPDYSELVMPETDIGMESALQKEKMNNFNMRWWSQDKK